MADGGRGERRSPFRRAVSLFDPAEEGFLRRIAALVAIVALVGLCALGIVATRLGGTATGRYWLGVLLLETGQHARAEAIARDLVAGPGDPAYGHYRLLAAALRRQGGYDRQVEVLDEAVAAFPDLDTAHGHRCWYGTLAGREDEVMDSCDRAVALARSKSAGSAHFWRAAARAGTGDLEGAVADLEDARSAWDAGAVSPGTYRRTARSWLEALRAGSNPIDEDELARLRGWF